MRPSLCIKVVLLALFIVGATAYDKILTTALVRRRLRSGSSKSSKSRTGKHRTGRSSSMSRKKSSHSPSKKRMSSGSSSKKKSKKKKSTSSDSSSKKKSSSSSDTKKESSSSSSSKDKKHSSSKKKDSSSSSNSKSKPSPSKSKSKTRQSSPPDSEDKGKGGEPSPSSPDSGKGGEVKGGKVSTMFAYEGEPCGEDINGGCDSDPPKYGSIKFDQTLIGEFGTLLDPDMETFDLDSDWFLFDTDKPACVQVTIASNYEGTAVLFEGSTFETATCLENLVDLASGDTSGNPAIYCFPEAGQYGVFVAPTFAVETTCDGHPFKYYLALEYIECGTCLIASGSPGCSDTKCRKRVCKDDKSCCEDGWTVTCVDLARELCDCEGGDGKIITEDEPCGENINGGCFNDPPAFDSIELGQTIVGEYGAVFNPEQGFFGQDSDWFLFELEKPSCVRATLDSIDSGDIILFEGSTFDIETCKDDLTNVASGDNSGEPAVYCFDKAGEYGVFVASTFVDMSPCEGKVHSYILTVELLGQCGTCLMENGSPGCANKSCESAVCELDESCCEGIWDAICVQKANLWCECAGGEAPHAIFEDEPCGGDINGGCFDDPPAYGSIELGQTLVGEYGAVFNADDDIYELDSDWYLFHIENDDTCVEAILTSRKSGDVILFEGSTFETETCSEDLVNVASGDNGGNSAVYCFPEAGEYGVFIAPTFQDKSPCEGEPNTYVLTLNGLECGNCFIERDSPGCSDEKCRKKVCDYDHSCCKDAWDATCVEKAKLWCDCSKDDKPDSGKGKGQSKPSDSKTKSSKSMKMSSDSLDSGKGKGSRPSASSDGSGKGKGGASSRKRP